MVKLYWEDTLEFFAEPLKQEPDSDLIYKEGMSRVMSWKESLTKTDQKILDRKREGLSTRKVVQGLKVRRWSKIREIENWKLQVKELIGA